VNALVASHAVTSAVCRPVKRRQTCDQWRNYTLSAAEGKMMHAASKPAIILYSVYQTA